jgi:polyisoprenoid-binding protein YceI
MPRPALPRPALRRLLPALLVALALMAGLAPARAAASVYEIDQQFGRIEFSVRSLGLVPTTGQFQRFHGRLDLDFAHPPASSVDVTIDAGSVDLAWKPAVAMLRSPDFFDVPQYPQIHFTSDAVEQVAPDRFRIHGRLMLRGVTRPQELDATLLGRRHPAGAGPGEVADFVVTGALRRSDFGMTAERFLIGNAVRFTIHARILLDHAAD